ncbi:sensor histidine kinase [Flagellimonas sediminis]|uniref:histidine kinase n=1 Tax=Flagellimonas sediminis TaxID=2696468 RepID=A0A6I5KTY7_9FLAO|nr:PAS domain-containing sensor histidine kinase [Allomuricauda sediminis]NDV43179.1 PAS domain-containing protein [Allomuricauda sediminis]
MKEKQVLIHNKVEIVEDRGDVVWAMDNDYKLTAFNSSFEQKLIDEHLGAAHKGMDLRSIYGMGVFFSPCEQGCEKALNRYATTSEHTFIHNGCTMIHEFTFQPFMDSTGNVIGCCIWQKDVTKEINNVHRLEESEQRYKEAQEITNLGHWNWDMVKDEITWSDQLFHIFGQVPGKFDATFEALIDIIHPEDRQVFQEDVERCINNKVLHDIVHRIVVNNGEVRYVHQIGRAFYDMNGIPYRMSGTTQDITKDVLSNQQIVQQNSELQNFVRIISHNLRGPISNLLMLSKIYDWGTNDMNDDIMKKIELTTEALDQTIKDLNLSLSLKRVDKEQFMKVRMKEVMKDVDGLLSDEIEKKHAIIQTNFTQVEEIKGIKSYFNNIFYNLILNALHYSKEEERPLIRISAEENDSTIILRVSDNGIGIELTPEKERKIFDMYGRLSGATDGKGLGLYLVKTQVEAMDGKIEVKSLKDVGTTFILQFQK